MNRFDMSWNWLEKNGCLLSENSYDNYHRAQSLVAFIKDIEEIVTKNFYSIEYGNRCTCGRPHQEYCGI